ncbi:MAG: hypothetical protein M1834_005789 [Cirrosporium novae-zelandiae]|nr:MAG: hypothetical protein M1834_005789 [Cirrosporium novae-zelandiae]
MAPPDAAVYPAATGPAKNIVDKHSEPADLVLYSGWFCPYVEVNPYHKPESLLKLNPRGLVPTLQYQNKPLFESNVVLEFLEDAYPSHKPSLRPSDPYERARARIWTDYVTTRIIPGYHRFLQFQPGRSDKTIEDVRQEFLNHLKEWTNEMDPAGPFFLGKEPSLIDFVMGPWALRLWVFDQFKGGLGIPETGASNDDKTWIRWRKWYDAISAHPSLKNTMSDGEHYIPLYKR